MSHFSSDRRRLLQRLGLLAGGVGAAGFARALRSPALPFASELCASPASFDTPLLLPGASGLMGRLAPAGSRVDLAAVTRKDSGPRLAFVAGSASREHVNPILTLRRGEDVRIRLANDLDVPTVAHWHGLAVDTANDGNGETPIAPGETYAYAFTLRNRAGLYWYHPHPHGTTAGQVSRGLFGLLAVGDDEDDALARAMELVPGETEIPLVLHERRSAQVDDGYAPSAQELLLGWLGDETLVNFTARPYLDVAARRYRLRVLNATHARNYRLAFRRDDGAPLPFLLLGTDGGLLERAQPCTEAFLSPAERIDVLVDFSGVGRERFALLESRAFDPMHALPAARSPTAAPAAAAASDEHAMRPAASAAPMGLGVADGAPLQLMQFRVRRGGTATLPSLPARLCEPFAPVTEAAEARALRLSFAKNRWRINDQVYAPGETPIVVARDAIETWLVRNYHTSMPHAMHLHGFQFRVLARETSPEQLAPLVVADEGRLATDLGWKDTVLVWPGESVKIAIDFRHRFAGAQVYLFHCHNLEHEDAGMMLRVKVG